jgi:hypothetical protein
MARSQRRDANGEVVLTVGQAQPALVVLDRAMRASDDAQRWWRVAIVNYWAYYQLVRVEGDSTPAALIGQASVKNALGVTATVLYRDPAMQRRWPHVVFVRDCLEGLLPVQISGPPVIVNPNLHLLNPPGQKPGGTTQREPDLPIEALRDGLFADAVAKVQRRLASRPADKRNGRPPWIKELSKELLARPRTVQWWLQQYPDLRQMLDEAAGAL